MISRVTKAATIGFAFVVFQVEGHSNQVKPPPSWPDGFYSKNSPSGTIDGASVLPVPDGMTYTAGGEANMNAFWTAFNASSFKSLKDFVWETQVLADGASKECGFSLVDGTPQPLPDMVEWTTMTHPGFIIILCDDTIVANIKNAAVEAPEKVPYDKQACEGASMLTSIWVAFHSLPWQVYTNCAPLSGGTGQSTPSAEKPSKTSSSSNGTPPSNAPTPSQPSTSPSGTPSNAPTPSQPSTSPSGTPPSNAPTPSQPSTSPSGTPPSNAPSSSTNKCTRRI